MKTFRFLLLGALCGSLVGITHAQETPAIAPPYVPLAERPLLQIPAPSPWEKEIAAYEAADKKAFPAPGGVLFIGSSSIRLWSSLATDFPGLNALNRGFGGSMITDSTQFAPRIVWPYAPSKIVFYAGTNDINSGKSAQQVFKDWQNFVATVRQKLPATQITFLSMVGAPSRLKDLDKVLAGNALIKEWNATQKGLDFVDVYTPLLGADGQPRLELFRKDRLHLTPAGYAIWREVLTPVLLPEKSQS